FRIGLQDERATDEARRGRAGVPERTGAALRAGLARPPGRSDRRLAGSERALRARAAGIPGRLGDGRAVLELRAAGRDDRSETHLRRRDRSLPPLGALLPRPGGRNRDGRVSPGAPGERPRVSASAL